MDTKKINIKHVSKLCVAVKNAISAVSSNTTLLKNFPHGCCRDASLILAFTLVSEGYQSAVYCWKENDTLMPSHAWLKYGNYFLDLTADQFDSKYDLLIIDEAGAPNSLYRIDNQEKPSLAIAGLDAYSLLSDYNLVLDYLNKKLPNK